MARGAGILSLPHTGKGRELGRERAPEPVPTTDVEWLSAIEEDIHALREEYVIPRLFQRLSDNLATVGEFRILDTQDRRVSFLIVSVFTGQLDVYTGEGASLTNTPHMRFAVTNFPIIIPMAPQPYKITAFASAVNTTFSIFAVS